MREVLRSEKKYMLNLAEARALRGRVESILQADSHSLSEGYLVRSLYFDTLYDTDLSEKYDGVELRRKIRLRIYDPEADTAYLEIKQKQDKYQRKRSLELPKEDALRLVHADYSVLTKYDTDLARELYVLMQTRFYRPVVVVDYKRSAFIGKEKNTRITFDYDIRACKTSFDIFDPNLKTSPVFDPSGTVLEVKYNDFLVSYIKDLLSPINRSETSVSKYLLARENL